MRVLIISPHYLPGYRAGGIIRSLTNLTERLGDEFSFYVVTRDRDLGVSQPYPESETTNWGAVGKAQVKYLAPSLWNGLRIRRIIREVQPECLYFNTVFGVYFGILPLLLTCFGSLRTLPKIIATHGCMSPNALSLKSWRKRVYLRLLRVLGSFNQVVWHATSEEERHDIRRVIGSRAAVQVASNLAPAANISTTQPPPKTPGHARLAFVGRIVEIKNLVMALSVLQRVKAKIAFDIFGPLEDRAYWQSCQQLVANLPDNITVHYQGVLPPERVVATLTGYDALFLPTRSENYGYVIIEAMSAGCPVVISDRTPWRHLEQLGVGWDCPLEDASAFQQAIEDLAAMSDTKLTQMRRVAAIFAKKVASNDRAIDAYRCLFHAVMRHQANQATLKRAA